MMKFFDDTNPLIGQFISFLRKPSYKIFATEQLRKRDKIWFISRLFALQFALAFLFSILITIVLNSIFKYKVEQNAVVELLQKGNPFIVFVLTVILAPITEELAFRMGLRRKRISIAIGSAFLIVLLLTLFSRLIPQLNMLLTAVSSKGALVWYGSYILAGIILSINIFGLLKVAKVSEIEQFYEKYFPYLYYSSSLLFGLIHITNYREWSLLIATPLIVAPQIIGGLTLGYIRVRFGIIWSIATHMLQNFISVVPVLILTSAAPNLLNLIGAANIDIKGLSTQEIISLIVTAGVYGTIISVVSIVMIISLIEYSFYLFNNHRVRKV